MFDVDGWLRSTEEEKEAGQGRACCRNWVTSLFDVCQAFRLCHSGQFRPPFRGSQLQRGDPVCLLQWSSPSSDHQVENAE